MNTKAALAANSAIILLINNLLFLS